MNQKVAMKFLKLWRAFKEGLHDFYSEGWLSVATLSVLTLSLFVVSLVYIAGASSSKVLENFENQVNVSVYFYPEVEEQTINEIKTRIENVDNVESVRYVSKEQALENFKNSKGNDPLIMKALEEIGENPLWSSLVVKARDSKDYEEITNGIANSDFKDSVSRINYQQNKKVIEKLTGFIANVRKVGVVIGIIFISISILITFNTIRLTLYSHKQEFEVMRLVGASNMYIRMPFLFGGILYGFISSVLSMLFLFFTLKYLSGFTHVLFPADANILSFYYQQIWYLFGALTLFGCGLGFISSLIAIRRYLKV